jgi:GT2 family glycosyltransferase
MENKFAIGIPTLNRFDLLHPALLFYIRDFPNTKIFIVDNGQQGINEKLKHPNIIVIEQEKNIGVSASFNILFDEIYKQHDYALIMNDDVYYGRKDWEVDNLLSNYKKDFYVSSIDWSVFILPKKTYKQVGKFDENFYPAYFEDNDFKYRMQLMNKSFFEIPFLNCFVHQTSQTLDREPSIKNYFEKNKSYYISKWGGEPNKEKFKKPFNK